MGPNSIVVKYVLEQKIGELKKFGEGCESGCDENCNEPTCSVKGRELNE
jgi:hypothetical protein